MKNTNIALFGSILVTALLANSSAFAGQTSITNVTESAPISRALDAELFPTDQSHYTGASTNRVNYSMENAPKLTSIYSRSSAISGQAGVTLVSESALISKALDAELFPTDQPNYAARSSSSRVNYTMESAPISAELDAELFPNHSR